MCGSKMKNVKNGSRTITQNDVAREAGVTRSIVSYVINGNNDRSVAPETRKKILNAIERLGYRPNKAAQALQQGDVLFASKRIGVILSDPMIFTKPYYSEILSGIHTEAHEQKHHISYIRFFDELKDPVLFNQLIHEEEVGGLILLATDISIKTEADKRIIERIKERLTRVITVEWEYPGISSIWFDRTNSAKKAADFLFDKGYLDLAYIGEMDDRVTGVKKSLSSHGIKPESLFLEAALDLSSGYRAAHKMLASLKQLPQAVVCGSDEVAIGVMCFCKEHQISIPDQIGLISIDNIEMSRYTTPPLTTLNVQKRLMGVKAVDLIINRPEEEWLKVQKIQLPTTIVERESC